jgi:hypothetical protein
MIGVSSHLDKLKYLLRRLSPQRELVPDVRPVPKAVGRKLYHSASRAWIIAGLAGFLILSQSRDGPDLYGAVSRFDTIPSRPMPAGLQEDSGAIIAGVVAQHDAEPAPSQQPRHRAPAGRRRTASPR